MRTALGEEDYGGVPKTAAKLIAIAAIIGGTLLVAIVTSQLSAIATKEKVDPQAGAQREAKYLKGHVIIAGLGELGYRIARLLCQANVGCVVISPAGDDRFLGAVETLAPVLSGSIRLEENLKRANIGAAAALIACSSDHLSNVEACMRAERLALETGRPLRTVARVFRDSWAAEAAEGFEIDSSLSGAEMAAITFAEAALDPDGRHRVEVGDLQLIASRYEASQAIPAEGVADWRAQGIRVIATARQSATNPGLRIVEGGGAVGVEAGDELLTIRAEPPSEV